MIDCPRLVYEWTGISGRGCRVGELSVAVYAWDLLKEVTIIFITSTIV